MKKRLSDFLKIFIAFSVVFCSIMLISFNASDNTTVATISQIGSSGAEVRAIQRLLKDYGLFNEEITGYYGTATERAVKRFQKANGISQTGIAGPQTLAAMGISIGEIPEATQAISEL